MSVSTSRLAVVFLLLSLGGSVQLLRGRTEVLPNSLPLQRFPSTLGAWTSSGDESISQDIRDVLGPADILSRNYRKPNTPVIDFLVVYFVSQRAGDTIHSPKNCLPGSGWQPLDSGRVEIALGRGQSLTATKYLIGRGDDRQLVLYWFQSHGKTTASEYSAKFQLITDAIRFNRTDGALVRVVTPVLPRETEAQSEARAIEFVRLMYPALDGFIPL